MRYGGSTISYTAFDKQYILVASSPSSDTRFKGLYVSALSYGAWVSFGMQLSEDDAYNIMKAAFDLGVNVCSEIIYTSQWIRTSHSFILV